MSDKTHLKWRRVELGPDNPGAGNAAAQLFEGRNQIRLEIFVREDLQNRVDARRDDCVDPVQVRIALKSLPAKLIGKYFPREFQTWYRQTETQSLNQDETSRREKELDELFAADEFRVLVIEDFNATGLNGPVNSRMPIKDKSNQLYHPTNSLTCFLRRIGYSGKTGKKLGTAGLGRHVYYKASQLSAKLIYTVPTDLWREESGVRLNPLKARPLFFGQSLQREFAIREGGHQRLFSPYYHLTGIQEDGQPMPYGLQDDEASLVDEVRRDFNLARQPDEPGCSLIIPFPKNNFTEAGFVNSIVRDFSMPILSGGLVVEVNKLVIDAATVSSVSDVAEINHHNAFLRDALNAKPATTVSVDTDRLKRPFAADLVSPRELSLLGECFNDSGLVSVQTDIQFGPREEQRGSIIVTVQKIEGRHKGRHLVARSGLVLSRYSDASFRNSSNALVHVQSDNLGSLLRGIENPAHEYWVPGDADQYKCDCVQELIDFVRSSHQALVRILSNLDAEDDLSIFKDLVPAGPRPPGAAKASPFDLGFDTDSQTVSVSPSPAYDASLGTTWRVSIVYDSIHGSGRARKGFRPGTFDLREVPVKVKGGSIGESGDCHVDVTVDDQEGFQLKLGPCGFVGWADVRVHAVQLKMVGGELA